LTDSVPFAREEKIGKKKKKDSSSNEKKDSAETVKMFGDEERPDFECGLTYEKEATEEYCIWDDPISYELQVLQISKIATFQIIFKLLFSYISNVTVL
jgi:hypothetical protein